MSGPPRRPATVLVEGNLSSGKTTLLEHLQQTPGLATVAEPVHLWQDVAGSNLYALLFSDRARWGFMFQSYAQLTMTDVHVLPTAEDVKVMERSIHSGRYVFVENLWRAGEMTEAEYIILDTWFHRLTTLLSISPDLIVYLRSSPSVVLERMRRRGRDEESTISLAHLTDIHDLHDEWLVSGSAHAPSCPVMVLDADCDPHTVAQEFDRKKSGYPVLMTAAVATPTARR